MFHKLQVETNAKTEILINIIRRSGLPAKEPSQSQSTKEISQTVSLDGRNVRHLTLILFGLRWLSRFAEIDYLLIVIVPVLWYLLSYALGWWLVLLNLFGRVKRLDVVLLELLQWLFLSDIVLGKIFMNLSINHLCQLKNFLIRKRHYLIIKFFYPV